MTTAPSALAGLQVLVVDDQDPVRELLVAFVHAAGGTAHAFASARACMDAVDLLPEPDVLLTDFNMPGLDGVELLAQLRRRLPRLPAVICTGYPADVHAEGVPGPAAVVVTKPLLLADLLAAVAAARAAP